MQRICPFLATDDDGRTVVDGFDPDHRCRAVRPSRSVGRAQQLGTCLEASHSACERYIAAVAEHGPGGWPSPAADATFAQTRMVLDPAQAMRVGSARSFALPGRRWVVGGALATAGIAAVASGIAGGLGIAARGGGAETSPSPVAAATASPTQEPPVGSLSSAPAATSQPTTAPTPAATPTPLVSAAPTAQPSAQVRTYVVQTGDTLNGIATRFGTTVQALQQANGLGDSDIIRVGQVLIIP